jgi:AcrR family transcriptional regulator
MVKFALYKQGRKMKVAQKSKDKRRIRGEESRALILQAAISSIAALGLGNMTLDRVAKRAGISRALVVFHFKSKNKLIEEVLNYLGNQYSAGWDLVVKDETGPAMLRILRLVDYDIRFACENPQYVSAWHAFWGESKGNALYRELVVPRDERYESEMKQLFSRVIEEEGSDKAELTSITTGLYVMLFGIWVESHLNPGPDDYNRYMKAARLFLSKIFPKQPLPELSG